MSERILLSIIESPIHPDFSVLYERLGFSHVVVNSMRKALSKIKTISPEYVVAEFFYGYGNNYAGVNISNLDVFLYSLEKYAPESRVIALVHKHERQHAERLNEIIPFHAIAQYPVTAKDIEGIIND
jgi:hypothetical protein